MEEKHWNKCGLGYSLVKDTHFKECEAERSRSSFVSALLPLTKSFSWIT